MPLDILSRLGLGEVPQQRKKLPSPTDRNAIRRVETIPDPDTEWWKGLVEGGIEGLTSLIPGSSVINFDPTEMGLELVGGKALSGAAKVLEAGLPFVAYRKQLLHGSPFKRQILQSGAFDPEKINPDWYPKTIHAAETPKVANEYARPVDASGSHGIIPVELGAKNVLDLIDLNYDDLEKVSRYIKDSPHTAFPLNGYYGPKEFDNVVRELKSGQRTPRKFDLSNPDIVQDPIYSYLQDRTKNLSGENLTEMGFDAVRHSYYDDGIAWAWPQSTPVFNTEYGIQSELTPRRYRR